MAKIGVSVSMTFRLGDPQMNEYAKVAITVDDIDTEQPLKEQLQRSAQTIGGVYDMTYKMLDKRVSEMLGGGQGD